MDAKTRAWLKGFHILFACAWIGTGLSMVVLGFVKSYLPDGNELYAINTSFQLLDDIIIPAAMGSFLTGLLICWFTNWGFMKHNWIIFKWTSAIVLILFGAFGLGPWVNGATAIVAAQRSMALHSQTYLYFRELTDYFGGIQVLLLVIVVFVTVLKPWGKRVR